MKIDIDDTLFFCTFVTIIHNIYKNYNFIHLTCLQNSDEEIVLKIRFVEYKKCKN
jgi:hypothetical protein